MKKTYLEPEIEVVKIQKCTLLAGSEIGEDGKAPQDPTPGGDDDF